MTSPPCGSVLQELKSVANAKTPRVNALMDKVFVRNNLTCQSTVEVPYFSSGCFRDICYYCAGSDKLERNEGAYPFCGKCSNKEAPTKRKHNLFKEKKQKIQEKLSCIVQNFAVCLVTNVRLKIT